ncbi:MAG: hypothetical protein RL168_476 [Bacteroidota bacterium]
MRRSRKNRPFIRWAIAAAVLFVLGIIGYTQTINAPVYQGEEGYSLYVSDTGVSIDEVFQPLMQEAKVPHPRVFTLLLSLKGNPKARRGHYRLHNGVGMLQAIRMLEYGFEDPIWLRMRGYQTRAQIAQQWSELFGYPMDSAQKALEVDLGFEQLVPNSYQVYWSYSPKALVERLRREYVVFWTETRKAKAARLKLSPQQVVVLASIVQAETKQADERSRVASLYLTRLKLGKRLEADPTAVYAYLQRYPKAGVIRRVTTKITGMDHPYNTYRRSGLPPGAMATVEPEVLDAVLEAAPSGELYMCADPKRPGYHVFARSYAEHLRNSARYHESLNRRGIRR